MSPTDEQICRLAEQPDDDDMPAGRPPLLSVCIKDPRVLQRCYLPFLQRGGLFVPSERPCHLRQRFFLILRLPAPPGAPDAWVMHAITATVVWLTPALAQGESGMGFGLHFDDCQPEQDLRQSIESLLNALL